MLEDSCWESARGFYLRGQEEEEKQKERVETAYRLVRELDPYHPVTLNVNDDAARFLPWSAVSDIPSIDYYPLPHLPAGRTANVAQGLEQLAPYRPLRFWLQSYTAPEERRFREPTPRELLGMAYMVAVHGGNLFLYFCYKPMSPDLFDMWGQLSREGTRLEAALTAESRAAVEVRPPAAPIQASLRLVGEQALLLAVNQSAQELEVSLLLPQDLRASTGTVLFEDRPITLRDGRITDTFEALERHVYQLELTP